MKFRDVGVNMRAEPHRMHSLVGMSIQFRQAVVGKNFEEGAIGESSLDGCIHVS